MSMNNRKLKTTLCSIALAALASVATNASAVTSQRVIMQLGPGSCGANNPANDQYLRRLPTGLKNATTTNISVVCSLWADDPSPAAMSFVGVFFKNEKATGSTVNCTLSAGTPYYGQIASTKSLYVAAGGTSQINWNTSDYGSGTDTQWVNVQCSVPAGWSMRELSYFYEEEVGT
jgi:hypothetical protein